MLNHPGKAAAAPPDAVPERHDAAAFFRPNDGMTMESKRNHPQSTPARPAGKAGASIARDLSRLRQLGRDRAVTLEEAAEICAGRSMPLLLLFLGLLALVPSPGLPVGFFVGLLIIIVALAVLLGMLARSRHPIALPGILGRRSLPAAHMRRFMTHAIPTVRKLERHFRPRLPWMVGGLGLVLAMLGIILQAAALALPIPFANAPFATGIVLIALGLLTRDGLGVLAGQVLGLLSFGLFGTIGIVAVRSGATLADYLPW